ncbi:hypothetical protein DICA1_B14114 [Diutina catenulata]
MTDQIRAGWEDLRKQYFDANQREFRVINNPNPSGATPEPIDPPAAAKPEPEQSFGTTVPTPPNPDEIVGSVENSELLTMVETLPNCDVYKQELKNLVMEWYWKGFYNGFNHGTDQAK